MRRPSAGLLTLVMIVWPALAIAAEGTRLVSITTPRGVTQSFIEITPKEPKAILILFAGGHGALQLRSATEMGWGKGNFLVRSRDRLAALGFVVVVVDAPSDKQDGMNAVFRMSGKHARDIEAVIAHVRKSAPLPVWLVGTSMGTFSAAGISVHTKSIDGIVLTSSITRSKPDWKIRESHPNGVASIPLSRFRGPALIMSHVKDACDITPAADAGKLKRALSASSKVSVVLIEGGLPPRSGECDAFSEHGFLGVEDKALAAIAIFVRENSRALAPAQ